MARTLTDIDHVDHEALIALPAQESATTVSWGRRLCNLIDKVPDTADHFDQESSARAEIPTG
jgi:hypothetical protein